MQLNWITVGMMIIVALIAYTGYKVFKLMKTLKTPPVITHEQKPSREYFQEDSPISQPVTPPRQQPRPQPASISQPKLAPPAFFRKPPVQLSGESLSHAFGDKANAFGDKANAFGVQEESEEEEIETEMFNLNEETEYNDQQSEMIIPLNLNNIIKQVVNQKIRPASERIPTTIIKEVDSESSAASSYSSKSPSRCRPKRMSDVDTDTSISVVEEVEKPADKTPLNKMTITELKELAKKNNIKLTEGGKPKNKETLVKELSGF